MLPFPATKTQTKALAYENSGKMFCTLKFGSGKNATQFSGDLNINSSSIDFSPGTYVFYDASITISGGAVTCTDCKPGGAGVTFILTGDAPGNIGSLKISGGPVTPNAPGTPTTCTITAPGCSPGNVFASNAFKGLLFYINKSADGSNGKGSAPVSITANSTVSLTGGLYFPSVNATYTGNANANDCTELVAKQVDFAGNASVDQCSKLGTQTAQVRVCATRAMRPIMKLLADQRSVTALEFTLIATVLFALLLAVASSGM